MVVIVYVYQYPRGYLMQRVADSICIVNLIIIRYSVDRISLHESEQNACCVSSARLNADVGFAWLPTV